MKVIFQKHSWVKHYKSNDQYVILATPDDNYRLEDTGEPAYAYSQCNPDNTNGYVVWLRCQKEMEDGRFVKCKIKL